ncbi:hypothetical protein [Sulfuriferula thiophila]|uniref:hypothetical protein n=1 Tax=Sulfuriferula thiophila TaxID=1781211 RepID=UPI000F60B3E6|nr:hypothetical protein [Sulfuriferula thiophila]
MKAIQCFWWRYRRETLVGLALMLVAAAWLFSIAHASTPEVVLVIGEPYEQMRKHSSASLPPVIPGHVWGGDVEKPAILRFNDPQFGFTTPPAKFLAVSHDEQGRVATVRMSPQVDTLTLDEALKVVLGLQEQLRRGGWKVLSVRGNGDAPYIDTPEVREKIKQGKPYQAYWDADKKYGVSYWIARFADDKRPKEERYLITLTIGRSWRVALDLDE